MLKLDSVLQLKEGEEIRLVTKRHAATVVPQLFIAFLLIVIPFFFLFPLFNSGPTGIVAFLALIAAGLIVAWRGFAMWDGDVFVLSNLRAIKVNQTGIFSRTVNEVAAEDIIDASWEKKGFFGYLFNYGNLVLGNADKLRVRHVPKPREIHALVREIVDAARKGEAKKSEREERAKRIMDAIGRMSDEELKKLEGNMNRQDRAETIDKLFRNDDAEDEEEEDKEDEEIPVKKLFGSDDDSNKLKPLDDED